MFHPSPLLSLLIRGRQQLVKNIINNKLNKSGDAASSDVDRDMRSGDVLHFSVRPALLFQKSEKKIWVADGRRPTAKTCPSSNCLSNQSNRVPDVPTIPDLTDLSSLPLRSLPYDPTRISSRAAIRRGPPFPVGRRRNRDRTRTNIFAEPRGTMMPVNLPRVWSRRPCASCQDKRRWGHA